jgi:hypothetical protein
MTTADGQSQLRRGGREIVIPTTPLILRFRIELQETDPLVWRAIEVPCDPLGSAGGVACAGS